MAASQTKRSSQFLVIVLSALLAVFAVTTNYIWSRHWKGKKIYPTDFDQDANFTIRDMPITYYEPGKLSEILTEWHHAFHLYRLKDGDEFKFDLKKFSGSTVRAKSLLKKCKWESAICSPCFDPAKKVTLVNTADIFKESGWYASFAKIDDKIVGALWDLLGLPFSVKDTNIEHAFISNLKESMITAQIHANPMTSSMAAQFLGKKTWIFIPPEYYRATDGFEAVPASPVLLPRHAPSKPFELYVYHARPGDVLFFPESWAHIVWTHKGPNFMVNYRRVALGNILRQPLTWITAAFNMAFFGKIYHDPSINSGAGHIQDAAVPEKELNIEVYNSVDGACKGGNITKFDHQLLDFIHRVQKDA